MNFIVRVFIILGCLMTIGYFLKARADELNKNELELEETLIVTSPGFASGEQMPNRYSGNGADVSPALYLENLVEEGVSIAIIMDDEDHPIRGYNHWVIWNIPARKVIDEGINEGVQGKSSYGSKHYYRGPKPPFGTHRYTFKVYVLDVMLDLDEDHRKKDLQEAMKGHILQYGTLSGTYTK